MLVNSTHKDLQPDIRIRTGVDARTCTKCKKYAIYEYMGVVLCRSCARQVQQTLKRIRGGCDKWNPLKL